MPSAAVVAVVAAVMALTVVKVAVGIKPARHLLVELLVQPFEFTVPAGHHLGRAVVETIVNEVVRWWQWRWRRGGAGGGGRRGGDGDGDGDGDGGGDGPPRRRKATATDRRGGGRRRAAAANLSLPGWRTVMLGLPARPWGPQSGGTSIGYEACLVAGYVWCLTEMISGGPTVIFGMLLQIRNGTFRERAG